MAIHVTQLASLLKSSWDHYSWHREPRTKECWERDRVKVVSRPRLASSSFFGSRLFFLLSFSLAAFQSKLAILGKLTPMVTCDWKWISKHSTTYHLHIMANRSIGGVFPITQLNSEQPHKFTARSERPHRAGRGWAQEWGRGGEKERCTFQKGRRQGGQRQGLVSTS